MTISLFEASIPVVTQMLTGLSGVLDKAGAFVAERGLDPRALTEARFAPDMYPLIRQVRVVTMWSGIIAGRLAGVEPPKFADDETTFGDLKARVARALEFVGSVDEKAINAAAGTVISFQAGPNMRRYKGRDFLLHFALPHFFFHCTTAYDLLRHSGVPLAKRDFMGPTLGVIED